MLHSATKACPQLRRTGACVSDRSAVATCLGLLALCLGRRRFCAFRAPRVCGLAFKALRFQGGKVYGFVWTEGSAGWEFMPRIWPFEWS